MSTLSSPDWRESQEKLGSFGARLVGRFGAPFIVNLGAIVFLGVLAVFSAENLGQHVGIKQIVNGLVGLCLLLGISITPTTTIRRLAWPAYFTALALILVVMIPGIGQSANGSQRWLSLGPFGALQPSELVKLAMILLLSHLYANPETRVTPSEEEETQPKRQLPAKLPLKRFILGGVATAVPFLLVAKQPDLGTALVIASIYFGVSLVAGMPLWFLGSILAVGASILPHVLKQYQKDRLLIFMHPEHDPQGMGYQLMQSRTAIGSGQFWGSGYLQGSMTQNGFVPENWTDFIFTVFGEEFGMIGCLGLGLLIGIFCLQMFHRICRCEESYLSLAQTGVLVMLAFQWIVNLFMTVGLAPVVGIPLPFCSYGGSALFVNLTALGLFRSPCRKETKI
jgi:rod shape determining protein RodA